LVAWVNSKIFIKFCEKFEGFWFEFDLKRIEKRFGKKKKKENLPPLPFGPAGRFPPPSQRPTSSFFFSFSSSADALVPLVSSGALLLASFLPLLCFARVSATAAGRDGSASPALSFLSLIACYGK
jgi:hypothetical protein